MASPGALPCLKTSALNSLAPVTTAPASSHHPPSPARAGGRKIGRQQQFIDQGAGRRGPEERERRRARASVTVAVE